MQPSPTTELIVHLVHGTFARGPVALIARNWRARRHPDWTEEQLTPHDGRYWFEKGSSLEGQLTPPDVAGALPIRFKRFLWSGNNSFRARKTAAAGLLQYLRQQIETAPRARHLVIAHSHGGTVIVEAADRMEEGSLAGILTLGTPFVRLRKKPHPNALEWSASALPFLLPWMAPLAALHVWLQAPNLAVQALAGAAGLAGLAALWKGWRALPLLLLLLCAAFYPPGVVQLLGNLTVWIVAFFCLFAAGSAMGAAEWIGDRLTNSLLRQWSELQTFLRAEPFRLPCLLYAIRTPNDEAGLAIGAAQFVEQAFRHTAALARALSENRRAVWLGLLVVALLAWAMVDHSIPVWLQVVGVIYLAGPVLILIALAMVATGLVPAAVCALAVGSEALIAPGLTEVQAEAVPYVDEPDRVTLRVRYDDDAVSQLNHSLYELPAIQEEIRTWIQGFRIPKTPVNPTKL